MRVLLVAVLVAGCGSPGPILEVVASNVPPGTSDVRTTVARDGPDETIRMVRWDGEDPFVYRVLVDLQGEVSVLVEAIVYTPGTAEPSIAGSDEEVATLAEDTVAKVEIAFP